VARAVAAARTVAAPRTVAAARTVATTRIPQYATDGLRAYWKLEESAGVRNDALGGNQLRTVTSGVVGVAGKLGQAASFPGTSGRYLRVLNADAGTFQPGAADFGMLGWFQLGQLVTSNTLLAIYSTGSNQRSWRLQITSQSAPANRLRLTVSDNGTGNSGHIIDVTDAAQLLASTWYFGAAWRSGSGYFVSLNAAPVNQTIAGTLTSSNPFASTAEFSMGSESGGNLLTGLMDNWLWFNRALTQADLDYHYNGGAGREI